MGFRDVGMQKILVFKTSADATIQRLFSELEDGVNRNIDCLVQHSQVISYKQKYPLINFWDIQSERFEDLPSNIMNMISQKQYDRIYVTLTGMYGYDFWNVIEIVSNVRFKRAFFYNCNGEKREIPRKRIIRENVCRLYIKWTGLFY